MEAGGGGGGGGRQLPPGESLPRGYPEGGALMVLDCHVQGLHRVHLPLDYLDHLLLTLCSSSCQLRSTRCPPMHLEPSIELEDGVGGAARMGAADCNPSALGVRSTSSLSS